MTRISMKTRSFLRGPFKLGEAKRLKLRNSLLKAGNIRRIHIIGAARSGTSLLHCAMAAFQNTIINSRESTTIWQPSVCGSLKLALRNVGRRESLIFVSKRNYGWFRNDALTALADDLQSSQIGIINMVRDPRDSLTSIHVGKDSTKYYLEPERWSASVLAADRLFQEIGQQAETLTIRYEDLVMQPDKIQSEIESTFSMQLRSGITKWSQLTDNFSDEKLHPSIKKALHSIRDFDANSVGNWRRDDARKAYWNEIFAGPYREDLRQFMCRHGYSVAADHPSKVQQESA